MDAFFNALKAKFQKGGSVKKYPRGVKEGGTPPKGKGIRPSGPPKDPKKPVDYTPPKGIRPASEGDKQRIKEKAKKIGEGRAKDSKMYGGGMKKKKMMHGGGKKKMY
jgi:hypothetical protein